MSLQSPEERYELLIEGLLQSGELWSLAQGAKLIRYQLQDGKLALPLWPAEESAALEAPDPGEQPRRITIEELIDSILPEIAGQNGLIAAFPLKGESYICEAAILLDRLIKEWDEDD